MTRSTVVDIHGWQTQTRDWWTESGIIEKLIMDGHNFIRPPLSTINTQRVFLSTYLTYLIKLYSLKKIRCPF